MHSHGGGGEAIYSPPVPARPGSFLLHPQFTAQCNEDNHTSPSYSLPLNSLPENQQNDIWNKWAFALPRRATQRSSCSSKEKITSNKGYRDLQILSCLCAAQAPGNFSQLVVEL